MLNAHTNNEIEKSVVRSQHTQRNWNLDKRLPKEDINTLLQAVTNCPSKQNIAFYKVHFIQNRNIIEEIHENTNGFGTGRGINLNGVRDTETNPQTLANLLVIFEDYNFLDDLEDDIHRNQATTEYIKNGKLSAAREAELDRDKQIAVGIASGYLNLTASLMGYRTGCCQCMDRNAIKEIAMLKEKPLLLMGVGFPQEGVNRKRHHIRDFTFPSLKKQPIKYEVLD
jgi:nitroreductase